VHVAGCGLVVLTGCGHAGIVNIVRYARALTGVERVYAVVGGFHLTGALFEPIIGATVQALGELAPQVGPYPRIVDTGWSIRRRAAA
jgi:7,8-dihydropterin-6-yl-methyl-4-(beta-D-ribofuranosyl)aminobenzene 5'-phosphate synthase